MPENGTQISNPVLTTPRAAAIAGILFALLYGAGYVLIQVSIPAISPDVAGLSEDQAKTITLG